jgi:hypothetical protein
MVAVKIAHGSDHIELTLKEKKSADESAAKQECSSSLQAKNLERYGPIFRTALLRTKFILYA